MGSSGNGAATSSVFGGAGWYVGWLFTVAFSHLSLGKAVLALLIWPYYLGVALGG
jgi:hypothetical protein